MKAWAAIATLLLCAGIAAAASPAVTLLALDGGLGAGVPKCIDRFSGAVAAVPVTFLATPDRDAKITAEVYVDGDKLAAPLHTKIPFEPAAAASHPALLAGVFVLPLPKTDSHALLRVLVVSTEDNRTETVAEFGVRLLPASELRQTLSAWLQPAETHKLRRVLLFGRLRGLREMLREWEIAFKDDGQEAPLEIPPGTLAIGEDAGPASIADAALQDHSSLLLFDPLAAGVSGVRQTVSPLRLSTVVQGSLQENACRLASFHQLLLHHLQLQPNP